MSDVTCKGKAEVVCCVVWRGAFLKCLSESPEHMVHPPRTGLSDGTGHFATKSPRPFFS